MKGNRNSVCRTSCRFICRQYLFFVYCHLVCLSVHCECASHHWIVIRLPSQSAESSVCFLLCFVEFLHCPFAGCVPFLRRHASLRVHMYTSAHGLDLSLGSGAIASIAAFWASAVAMKAWFGLLCFVGPAPRLIPPVPPLLFRECSLRCVSLAAWLPASSLAALDVLFQLLDDPLRTADSGAYDRAWAHLSNGVPPSGWSALPVCPAQSTLRVGQDVRGGATGTQPFGPDHPLGNVCTLTRFSY